MSFSNDRFGINYALGAENSVGEGPRAMSPGIIVGKPYDLPFEEHFKGGRLDKQARAEHVGGEVLAFVW